MSEDVLVVAREALDLAKDVDRRVNSHEDICALRYEQLHASIAAVKKDVGDSVGDIKKVLGWAGATLVVVMMSVLGFFLKAQFDANAEMQRQLNSLQQQPSEYEQPK